ILFLAWMLFRERRKIGVPALLFAPLAICLSGFVVGNTPDPALRLAGAAGSIAHFASGWTVIFLWWFCLACFDRQFTPRGPVLAVGLGWFALASADRIIPGAVPALSYTLLGLGFGIVAHLIWRLHAEREGDLIEKRHDARSAVALVLGGLLLIDLSIDLLFGFDWRPRPFAMAQNAAILGFALWLGARVLAARTDVLSFAGLARGAPSSLRLASAREDRALDRDLRQRLVRLVEVERIHLDPELTFAMFVERMNAPERAVRKLVNHELGFDHFRSFLNHYRVIEACRLLADPNRSAEKLIAIALDSGFASLPSFNRVFRATEGCTPSEYRMRCLAPDPGAKSRAASAKSSSLTGFERRSAGF
ncbi:MAG TPA: helix-turn-helix domain-containing protein, partial [Allosphingosinicella sp.]|nr:helix-turn-helix domain-containing protein [Allosphingosinicella sp.]